MSSRQIWDGSLTEVPPSVNRLRLDWLDMHVGTAQMTFTERSFRDALSLFPTGVAVVTTLTKDGARIGATVSSFNSVSLSPPLVLFSIARTSRSFAVWCDAETYRINLLNEHQHVRSNKVPHGL